MLKVKSAFGERGVAGMRSRRADTMLGARAGVNVASCGVQRV
jgi:hypothetical protein